MVTIGRGSVALIAIGALFLGAALGEQIAERSLGRQLTRVQHELAAINAAVATRDNASPAPACPPVACAASDVDYDRIARIVAGGSTDSGGTARRPAAGGSAPPAQEGAPPAPSEASKKGIADGSQMIDRAAQTGVWTDADVNAFHTALRQIDDDSEREALTQRLIVLVNDGKVHPTTTRRPF